MIRFPFYDRQTYNFQIFLKLILKFFHLNFRLFRVKCTFESVISDSVAIYYMSILSMALLSSQYIFQIILQLNTSQNGKYQKLKKTNCSK